MRTFKQDFTHNLQIKISLVQVQALAIMTDRVDSAVFPIF
jgi:hypothetical protein